MDRRRRVITQTHFVYTREPKIDIFQIFSKYCDLDQGQGHQMSHIFEGLSTSYLLTKNHNSTVNNV